MRTITFGEELKPPFAKAETLKIVAFRVDPSAPGTAPILTSVFGSVPQIRLILQPVTINDDGVIQVHDLTVHLVFNYIKSFDPPAAEGLPPRAVPDDETFQKIVDDLKSLKQFLAEANVDTAGNLTVHPGFEENVPGFRDRVLSFLKRHLKNERLSAVAFMGLDRPEPWIFFAMTHRNGEMEMSTHRTLGGKPAQMLTFRGGDHVMPKPMTANIDRSRGVSTSVLFSPNAASKFDDPVFEDTDLPRLRDISDIIANPETSHFFNTDCVSCHSESARRKELNTGDVDPQFRFQLPPGISGVDSELLPQNKWNVRNLGWFQRRTVVPTVTMRTANEAAESADFINKKYLRDL